MELRKCPVCGGKLRSEALGWICYDCQGFIDMQGVFHEHIEKQFMPPQTNADRIRAMSDEELAEFICGIFDDDEYFGKFINGRIIPCYDQHKIAEWLKQPAE